MIFLSFYNDIQKFLNCYGLTLDFLKRYANLGFIAISVPFNTVFILYTVGHH